jgi:hypothetical protein
MKVFYKTNLLCCFHISKLNDLKVIHDLYFQYLTQTLSKTTLFTKLEWSIRQKILPLKRYSDIVRAFAL